MIFFSVPVLLIEALTILHVLIGVFLVSLFIVIVLSAILLVQVLEPLTTE